MRTEKKIDIIQENFKIVEINVFRFSCSNMFLDAW